MGKKVVSHPLALFAVLVAAFSIAGCGTDRSNLLSSETATGLAQEIDRVNTLVDAGDCFSALESAEAARAEVEGLGGEIDPRLRTTLLDGLTELQIMIQAECAESAGGSREDETVIEETDPSPVEDGGEEGQGGARPARPDPEPRPEPQPDPTPPDSGGVTPTPPSGGTEPGNG